MLPDRAGTASPAGGLIVQGARISREIVRWCREAGTPFAGIVSSVRLAAMYEKWGAEAGGHIGDIELPLASLVEEVLGHSSLPVVAAGGIDGRDIARYLAMGVAGVQLATRFIACSDGDAHPAFKEMYLGRSDEDVVVITSCVKGMKARAVRNAFTDALAAGEHFPPRSKAWFFGSAGYRGRRKPCIECLAQGLCRCQVSGFRGSFCIQDALLRAVKLGDTRNGLFYTGQSVTRIPEFRSVALLRHLRRRLRRQDRVAAQAAAHARCCGSPRWRSMLRCCSPSPRISTERDAMWRLIARNARAESSISRASWQSITIRVPGARCSTVSQSRLAASVSRTPSTAMMRMSPSALGEAIAVPWNDHIAT